MTHLTPLCQEIKERYQPKKKRSTRQPVKFWSEPDRYNNKTINAFVIILKTPGCSWSHTDGCTMCGYFTDSGTTADTITSADILQQFQYAMQHYQNEPIIKIFNSGSFFDTKEINQKTQEKILSTCAENTQKTQVESRPEYITQNTINILKPIIKNTNLEVGIGLETADDFIRKNAINKGFSLNQFTQAATLLNANDIDIKTYLLVKPLFITERDAIEDMIKSVKKIHQYSSTISFNPSNIQRYTLMEYFWKRNYYRPPWLWSIIQILKESKKITPTRLQCDIVGGGSPRGAHNCPNCNNSILKQIHDFSLTQNQDVFTKPTCPCHDSWLAQYETEKLSLGAIPDYYKVYQ